MRAPIRLAQLTLVFSAAIAGAQTEEARQSYNQTYRDPAKVYSAQPNAFLVRALSGRKPGKALDIGMGQGRNTLWLAENGWDVTGIDVSDEGIAQANAAARQRGLRIQTQRVGYAEFQYGEKQWDLIVLCYFLPKDLPARLLRALKPGGLVVVEGFHADTAFSRLLFDGLADNELPRLFAGYRTLLYEDVTAGADWGGALAEENRVVRLLAQRPSPPPSACRFDGRAFAPGQSVCWGPMTLRCESAGWKRAGSCETSGKND